MDAGRCRYQFRIALLGDAAVGKTSLLRCYAGIAEPGAPEPTAGVEFYSRALQLPAGPRVKLQLCDTAGHERFRCGRGLAGKEGGVHASPPGVGSLPWAFRPLGHSLSVIRSVIAVGWASAVPHLQPPSPRGASCPGGGFCTQTLNLEEWTAWG
jgi:GTPase SAR1 family protein